MRNLHIANTAIFLAVAFAHAVRVISQTPVWIGESELALWLSRIAVFGAGALAWFNWRAVQPRDARAVLTLIGNLFFIDALVLLYSWAAGLSYWGFSGTAFLWFALFDAVVIALIAWHLSRNAAAAK